MAELTGERCVACRRDAPRVTEAEIAELKPQIPDWRIEEADGFFFSGVGPGFFPDGGDALLLQYLHVPLDASLIQLANPFAKELLAYVERERARVGKSA